MSDAKKQFARQLRAAMQQRGLEPKPSILEREFNQRHWGKPITLHGVRRWLEGETMPDYAKLKTLSEWLNIPIENLVGLEINAKRPKTSPWHVGLGYDDQKLFEAFLKLAPPQKKLVREVILLAVKANMTDVSSAS